MITDQYVRKQDGVYLSSIQMVGLSSFQMAFKYKTILHSTSFRPIKYRNSSVFRSPLYSVRISFRTSLRIYWSYFHQKCALGLRLFWQAFVIFVKTSFCNFWIQSPLYSQCSVLDWAWRKLQSFWKKVVSRAFLIKAHFDSSLFKLLYDLRLMLGFLAQLRLILSLPSDIQNVRILGMWIPNDSSIQMVRWSNAIWISDSPTIWILVPSCFLFWYLKGWSNT